jgi:hypothetical protein
MTPTETSCASRTPASTCQASSKSLTLNSRCHLVVRRPAQELVADSVPMGLQYITLLTCSWIPIFIRLIPMADSESSDSPQAKLFYECRQGFKTRDLDRAGKVLHKDFRYVSYPRSLGKPDQTKEEWLGQWAGILGLWVGDPEVGYIGCSSDSSTRLNPFAADLPFYRRHSGKTHCLRSYPKRPDPPQLLMYVTHPTDERQSEDLDRG